MSEGEDGDPVSELERRARQEARAAPRGLDRDGPAALAARPEVPGAEAGRRGEVIEAGTSCRSRPRSRSSSSTRSSTRSTRATRAVAPRGARGARRRVRRPRRRLQPAPRRGARSCSSGAERVAANAERAPRRGFAGSRRRRPRHRRARVRRARGRLGARARGRHRRRARRRRRRSSARRSRRRRRPQAAALSALREARPLLTDAAALARDIRPGVAAAAARRRGARPRARRGHARAAPRDRARRAGLEDTLAAVAELTRGPRDLRHARAAAAACSTRASRRSSFLAPAPDPVQLPRPLDAQRPEHDLRGRRRRHLVPHARRRGQDERGAPCGRAGAGPAREPVPGTRARTASARRATSRGCRASGSATCPATRARRPSRRAHRTA